MDEFLINLEKFARQNNIPVILDDTKDYLINLLAETKPKTILEIGMAIGYSGSVMLKNSQANLTCIEASKPNIALAKQNFMVQGLSARVEIIEGDCMQELPKLKGRKFDFIFLDGPKGKYLEMIDMILPLLNDDGVWVSDNVLFRGMVRDGEPVPAPRFVVTVQVLRDFLDTLENNPNLDTQVLHIGDGLSVTKFKR